MKVLILSMIFMMASGSLIIVDFSTGDDINNWRIINDAVMGGKSSSSFTKSAEGYAVFQGKVFLENNGGFCSVRYQFDMTSVEDFSGLAVTLKGDGKMYQFRIKANTRDYHSYISYINTSGDWQEIEIPLHKMYPTWRGMELDMPDFNHSQIEEIGILIGNKKAESFELYIEKIELR